MFDIAKLKNDELPDSLGISLTIYLTKYCNFNCEYCIAQEFTTKNNSYDSEYFNYLNNTIKVLSSKYTIKNITLMGGEPSSYPNFNKLFDIFNDFDIKNITLLTNASLVNSSIIETLNKFKNNIVIETTYHHSQWKRFDAFKKKIFFIYNNINNNIKIKIKFFKNVDNNFYNASYIDELKCLDCDVYLFDMKCDNLKSDPINPEIKLETTEYEIDGELISENEFYNLRTLNKICLDKEIVIYGINKMFDACLNIKIDDFSKIKPYTLCPQNKCYCKCNNCAIYSPRLSLKKFRQLYQDNKLKINQ